MTEFIENRHREGLVIGDPAESNSAGSLCISVLQWLSRKYWIKGPLEDLLIQNHSRRHWNELTSVITKDERARGEFQRALIKTYQDTERLRPESVLESVLKVFSDAIDGDESKSRLNEMICISDNDGVFRLIVLEDEFYEDKESHMEGLENHFLEFKHAQKFSQGVTKRYSDEEVIDLINYIVRIQTKLKNSKNFHEIRDHLESEDEDLELYLLHRMADLSSSLPEDDVKTHHLPRVLEWIVESLERELQIVLASRREDARDRGRHFEVLAGLGAMTEERKFEIENLLERLHGKEQLSRSEVLRLYFFYFCFL